ncbi:hypothetical protein FM120_03910 [Sphingobacterium faecium PCAi_F2.5]|nr:hypothetical protein FM120_03910 [Sphingobacterium faecium PCAi_F2.5]
MPVSVIAYAFFFCVGFMKKKKWHYGYNKQTQTISGIYQ